MSEEKLKETFKDFDHLSVQIEAYQEEINDAMEVKELIERKMKQSDQTQRDEFLKELIPREEIIDDLQKLKDKTLAKKIVLKKRLLKNAIAVNECYDVEGEKKEVAYHFDFELKKEL